MNWHKNLFIIKKRNIMTIRKKCYVCGVENSFTPLEGNLREAQCSNCLASVRNSDVAFSILKMIGQELSSCLQDNLEILSNYHIYETGRSGILSELLGQTNNYIFSEYKEGYQSGQYKDGILIQDLTSLSFTDNKFDLILSQDVFEHIGDPEKALSEIRRVLKPDGLFIFTVPLHEFSKTFKRANQNGNDIRTILPAVYHSDPNDENGCIVFTDWGIDTADILRKNGFETEQISLGNWYEPEEITNIQIENYEQYTKEWCEEKNLGFFKYNSHVFYAKNKKMIFTGERYLPELKGQIEYEHFNRYLMAKEYVKGKIVLDIACGEGYGSALLAEHAEFVLGVDISKETVNHAKFKYNSYKNLEFEVGECAKIPAKDKFFDIVVSFETIEHITEHESFLLEIKRVLKDNGIIIISSPNTEIYNDKVNYENEFHQKELTKKEFEELLKSSFEHVSLFGQRITFSSHIWSMNEAEKVSFKHYQQSGNKFTASNHPPYEPEYLVAVCSDEQIKDNVFASLYTSSANELLKDYHNRGLWGQSLHRELEELKSKLKMQDKELERKSRIIENQLELINADIVTMIEKAELEIETNNITEAKNLLNSVLKIDPKNLDAINDLAVVAIIEQKFNTAMDYLNQVLTIDSLNEVAKDNLNYLQSLIDSKGTKKNDNKDLSNLEIIKIDNYNEYLRYNNLMQQSYQKRNNFEKGLIKNVEKFYYRGKCYNCQQEVDFHVDFWNAYETNEGKIPNWRERLVCPLCHLNNRMRLSLHIINSIVPKLDDSKVYIAEQTTPMYSKLSTICKEIVGSEYLGNDFPKGKLNKQGIRHEDFTELTFDDGQFDLVLSFDVFEHIPDYKKSFQEAFRVLKPGGKLLFSVPFDRNSKNNIVRAKIDFDGSLIHILPAEYHGDPMNESEGCLCFYHFGWEILDDLKSAGFQDAYTLFAYSEEYGYLGGDQIFLIARKQKEFQENNIREIVKVEKIRKYEENNCPVCFSNNISQYTNKSGYNYYKCSSCNLISIENKYLNLIDEGGNIVEYSDKYWRMELIAAKDRASSTALGRMSEVFYYAQIPIKKFLDIGSGPGYFLDMVRKYLPSRMDTFYAQELFPPKFEDQTKEKNYIIGPLTNIDFKVDAGMCIEVIEHLTPKMLSNLFYSISIIANPQAIFIFNTGLNKYVESEDPDYLDPTVRGHIISYSLEAIQKIAEPFGFTVFPLSGRNWAFVIEYESKSLPNENLSNRVWSALKENTDILIDDEMGGIIKLLGFETTKAYQ